MKTKRILSLLIVFVLLVCMLPPVYAAETDTTDTSIELDPDLVEAGFTSDILIHGYVTIDSPGNYDIATRSVRKYATLRNCWQMDFITNTGYHQGFHFVDEDGSLPWDYMNMIYCLENKKSFSIGSGNAGSGDLTLEGSGTNHGEQIWYGLSYNQRIAVGLIILYGAPTKLWDESWGLNPEGDRNTHNPNMAYRWATQALIWEITGGWRDANYPYARNSSYWYDQSVGVCMSEDGQTDHFIYAYNSIVNDLLMHNTIPSFAGDLAALAPEIELMGTSTTVTDTNGVLHKFDFLNSDAVNYSKSGNDLTITTNGAPPTTVQETKAVVPNAKASIYEVWYNQYDSSKQTCIKISVPASDPVPAYFKLKSSTGTLNIIKTATNGGTVTGWHFTVKNSSGSIVGDYVTDSTGIITLDLEPGTYTVAEADSACEYWRNDPQATKTVTVKAGQAAKVIFQNQWIGAAKIIKALENPEAGKVNDWTFTISHVTYGSKDIQVKYLATVTTGADGTIVYGLEPGRYLITEELEENSLWQCISEQSQVITVTAGETAEVNFTNALRPGKISVQKVDTAGNYLAGAKFILEWSEDGTTWNPVFYSDSITVIKGGCSNVDIVDGTLLTSEDGIITWNNLYPDLQYRITELEAPKGFLLLKGTAFEGELPIEDLTVTIRVVNSRIFTLPETGSKSLALMSIGLLLCTVVCMGALFVLGQKKEV